MIKKIPAPELIVISLICSFDINKMFIGFFFLHFLDSRNGRDSVTQLLYLIQLGLMYVIHKEDIKYLAVIINLTESLHCHIPYLTATKIYFSCNWKLDSYTRWIFWEKKCQNFFFKHIKFLGRGLGFDCMGRATLNSMWESLQYYAVL